MAKRHPTQHKRLALWAHQNSAFGGTSFMLGTLCAMPDLYKEEINSKLEVKYEV